MYEYKTVLLPDVDDLPRWDRELNELAREGWRLVAVWDLIAFMERRAGYGTTDQQGGQEPGGIGVIEATAAEVPDEETDDHPLGGDLPPGTTDHAAAELADYSEYDNDSPRHEGH